jgi:hypothetical protein
VFQQCHRTRNATDPARNPPRPEPQVANLTQGSVVAAVVLHTPANWTASQVNTVASTLASPASLTSIFDPSFLSTYDISSVAVQARAVV